MHQLRPTISAPRTDRQLTTVQTDGDIEDDAAAYVALSEQGSLPRLDSNQQPFGERLLQAA